MDKLNLRMLALAGMLAAAVVGCVDDGKDGQNGADGSSGADGADGNDGQNA